LIILTAKDIFPKQKVTKSIYHLLNQDNTISCIEGSAARKKNKRQNQNGHFFILSKLLN